MSDLLNHNIQISEIYTEKPDLEAVFVDMINRSSDKNGLLELLDEIKPTSESESKDEDTTDSNEDKEDEE